MLQSLRVLSAMLLTLMLCVTAADSQPPSEEQKNVLVFGKRANMGQVLVENLANACHHTRTHTSSADPTRRTLLLADRKMTAFSAEACVGVCDRLQINNIVVRCRRDQGIAGCVIYGAVYEKRFFSFAIDPTAFDLERDCAK